MERAGATVLPVLIYHCGDRSSKQCSSEFEVKKMVEEEEKKCSLRINGSAGAGKPTTSWWSILMEVMALKTLAVGYCALVKKV